MITRILLITALLVPVGHCTHSPSGGDDLDLSTSSVVVTTGKRGWGAWNPLPAIFTAIGWNAQTAETAHRTSAASLRAATLAENTAVDARTAAADTRAAASSVSAAAVTMSGVSEQLQSSGALLSLLEQRNRDIGTLQTRLSIAEAAKIDAEACLQRLLSQVTPSAAATTADTERDDRIRSLETHMHEISARMTHILSERSTLQDQIETFRGQLATIVGVDETNINTLLEITAARMTRLTDINQASARIYQEAIQELGKQIREKDDLKRVLEERISTIQADSAALRAAAMKVEGNGYTHLFNVLIPRAKESSSTAEIAKLEEDITALILEAYVRSPPGTSFTQIIAMSDQEMWADRLLKHCKYTLDSDSEYNRTEGKFLNLAHLLLAPEQKLAKAGSRPDYSKAGVAAALGGLLRR